MKSFRFFVLIISLVFFLNIFLSFSFATLYIIKDQDGNNICITNLESLISKYKALGYTILVIQSSGLSQKFIEPEQKSESKSESSLIPTSSDETDSIIKVIDWTNYISNTGNYVYVEGILQNIGKVTVNNLKVCIQAFDKNDKLVSINETHADPSTLAPGKQAIFKTMISYKPEIYKFVLFTNK